MASGDNLSLTVNSEPLIQLALFRFLQMIANEHGIMITSIHAEWIDVKHVDRKPNRLWRITTESNFGPVDNGVTSREKPAL